MECMLLWTTALHPSRRSQFTLSTPHSGVPKGELLRMRSFLYAINKPPHAEERERMRARLEARHGSIAVRGRTIVSAFVYILRCADGSFYVGITRKSPEATPRRIRPPID